MPGHMLLTRMDGANSPARARVRLKFVYYGSEAGAGGWLEPLIPYHWTQLTNIKRDPFEQIMIGKSAQGIGRCTHVTVHRLHLRLESAADRSEDGAGSLGDLRQLPAPPGAGFLQPVSTDGGDQCAEADACDARGRRRRLARRPSHAARSKLAA